MSLLPLLADSSHSQFDLDKWGNSLEPYVGLLALAGGAAHKLSTLDVSQVPPILYPLKRAVSHPLFFVASGALALISSALQISRLAEKSFSQEPFHAKDGLFFVSGFLSSAAVFLGIGNRLLLFPWAFDLLQVGAATLAMGVNLVHLGILYQNPQEPGNVSPEDIALQMGLSAVFGLSIRSFQVTRLTVNLLRVAKGLVDDERGIFDLGAILKKHRDLTEALLSRKPPSSEIELTHRMNTLTEILISRLTKEAEVPMTLFDDLAYSESFLAGTAQLIRRNGDIIGQLYHSQTAGEYLQNIPNFYRSVSFDMKRFLLSGEAGTLQATRHARDVAHTGRVIMRIGEKKFGELFIPTSASPLSAQIAEWEAMGQLEKLREMPGEFLFRILEIDLSTRAVRDRTLNQAFRNIITNSSKAGASVDIPHYFSYHPTLDLEPVDALLRELTYFPHGSGGVIIRFEEANRRFIIINSTAPDYAATAVARARPHAEQLGWSVDFESYPNGNHRYVVRVKRNDLLIGTPVDESYPFQDPPLLTIT